MPSFEKGDKVKLINNNEQSSILEITNQNAIDSKLEVIQKKLDLLEEKSNFGFGIIMDDEED